MARAPAKRCNHPGCRKIIRGAARCDEHKRQSDKSRPNSNSRGYNHRWRKFALAWLANFPLCAECQRQGKVNAASCVDHIVPHRGDQERFWDTDNLQSLCAACHSVKTAKGQ